MFYKIDSTRITFLEYIRSTPIPALPVVLILKLLHVRLAIPAVVPDCLDPFLVDPSDIPNDVREKVQPLEDQMHDCGFVDPVYHWIVDPFSSARTCVVTLRHRSSRALSRVLFQQLGSREPYKETLYPAFITCYHDGSSLVSTGGRRDIKGPPTSKVLRVPGASVAELWKLHDQQNQLESSGKTMVVANSREEMLAVAAKYEADHREFQIARGVYVPRDEADQKMVETVMATPGTEDDRRFAAVYGEIERLANRKASWGSGILVFLVSIAIFLALGLTKTAWTSLLLLVGVLLFHEMGHLAAMAAFRYRNLRMFFIPFLGAIITGHNYNVPGWKKVIVLLAGPLPGLILGVILVVVSMVVHWPPLMLASAFLIILNGFNLLPLTPLDGGQVMEVLLFSRHPTLNAVVRTLAAVILILIGLANTKGLIALGVLVLFGVPTSYRVGKVVRLLRKREIDATSPDDQTIPVETARMIHDELRQVRAFRGNARTSARLTLSVFEMLNSVPPRWPTSLALVGIQCLCIAPAVLIVVMIAFPSWLGIQNSAMSFFAVRRQHALERGGVQTWEGADARHAHNARVNTLIANFDASQDAEAAYNAAIAALPSSAIAAVFGQSLLLELPEQDDQAREHWLNELKSRSDDVIVLHSGDAIDDPMAYCGPNCRITCCLPETDAANRLAEDAEDYCVLPAAMHLVPPWLPNHGPSARDQMARRTYLAILGQRSCSLDDERWTRQCEKIDEAHQRGDSPAEKRLTDELDQLSQDLEKEYIEQLYKDKASNEWDVAIIEQYERLPEPKQEGTLDNGENDGDGPKGSPNMARYLQDYHRWAIQFGAHLGQLPTDDGVPVPQSRRYSIGYGNAIRVDHTLYLSVAFERPATGAPAIADWLFRNGCTNVQYDFLQIDLGQ